MKPYKNLKIKRKKCFSWSNKWFWGKVEGWGRIKSKCWELNLERCRGIEGIK